MSADHLAITGCPQVRAAHHAMTGPQPVIAHATTGMSLLILISFLLGSCTTVSATQEPFLYFPLVASSVYTLPFIERALISFLSPDHTTTMFQPFGFLGS